MSQIRETFLPSLLLYKGAVSKIRETISPKPPPIKGRSEQDKEDYFSQAFPYKREE